MTDRRRPSDATEPDPDEQPDGGPWENFLTTQALENGFFLAACNHVGKEGDWVMSGKSMVIDPLGKILAKASPGDEEIITAEFEREAVIRARQRLPLARDRRPDAYGAIVRATEELHA